MKLALTNTAPITMLTIDPAILPAHRSEAATQEQEDAEQMQHRQQNHEQVQLVGPDEPGPTRGSTEAIEEACEDAVTAKKSERSFAVARCAPRLIASEVLRY
jgi:hypothetical protein